MLTKFGIDVLEILITTQLDSCKVVIFVLYDTIYHGELVIFIWCDKT